VTSVRGDAVKIFLINLEVELKEQIFLLAGQEVSMFVADGMCRFLSLPPVILPVALTVMVAAMGPTGRSAASAAPSAPSAVSAPALAGHQPARVGSAADEPPSTPAAAPKDATPDDRWVVLFLVLNQLGPLPYGAR
jgi:hypothetical protein